MQHVIDRVLASWIAICIEKSKGKVTAGVYGKTDLGDKVISCRCCFSATDGALDVGTADTELIIVARVGIKVLSFDLGQSVMAKMAE